jgi:hypothetical protein
MDKLRPIPRAGASFRLGKELYEQKFAYDIQSASTAEQTYQQGAGRARRAAGQYA